MIQGGAICHQYVYIYTVWLNFSHSLSENKCNSFTKAEFLFCSPAAECSNSGSPQSQLQPQLLCDTSVFFSKPFSLKLQWYTIKNRRGNQKTKRQCAYFKYPRLALCRHVLVSFLFEFPCPRCVELLAYLERKMKTPSFLQVICSLECCFHSCWLTNVLWSDLRPFGLTIPMKFKPGGRRSLAHNKVRRRQKCSATFVILVEILWKYYDLLPQQIAKSNQYFFCQLQLKLIITVFRYFWYGLHMLRGNSWMQP